MKKEPEAGRRYGVEAQMAVKLWKVVGGVVEERGGVRGERTNAQLVTQHKCQVTGKAYTFL